jgi:hypothetical protein
MVANRGSHMSKSPLVSETPLTDATPRTDAAVMHCDQTAVGFAELRECSERNELSCYAMERDRADLIAALRLTIGNPQVFGTYANDPTRFQAVFPADAWDAARALLARVQP